MRDSALVEWRVCDSELGSNNLAILSHIFSAYHLTEEISKFDPKTGNFGVSTRVNTKLNCKIDSTQLPKNLVGYPWFMPVTQMKLQCELWLPFLEWLNTKNPFENFKKMLKKFILMTARNEDYYTSEDYLRDSDWVKIIQLVWVYYDVIDSLSRLYKKAKNYLDIDAIKLLSVTASHPVLYSLSFANLRGRLPFDNVDPIEKLGMTDYGNFNPKVDARSKESFNFLNYKVLDCPTLRIKQSEIQSIWNYDFPMSVVDDYWNGSTKQIGEVKSCLKSTHDQKRVKRLMGSSEVVSIPNVKGKRKLIKRKKVETVSSSSDSKSTQRRVKNNKQWQEEDKDESKEVVIESPWTNTPVRTRCRRSRVRRFSEISRPEDNKDDHHKQERPKLRNSNRKIYKVPKEAKASKFITPVKGCLKKRDKEVMPIPYSDACTPLSGRPKGSKNYRRDTNILMTPTVQHFRVAIESIQREETIRNITANNKLKGKDKIHIRNLIGAPKTRNFIEPCEFDSKTLSGFQITKCPTK